MKSEWAKLLAEALTQEDKVPPGWKTSDQIAAEIGKSRPRVINLISPLIKAGRVKRKKFKVPFGNAARATWHYKMTCTPEDFEQEPDPAVSPQEQIYNRKNVGRVGETSKRDTARSKRVDRKEVPGGKQGARRRKHD